MRIHTRNLNPYKRNEEMLSTISHKGYNYFLHIFFSLSQVDDYFSGVNYSIIKRHVRAVYRDRGEGRRLSEMYSHDTNYW